LKFLPTTVAFLNNNFTGHNPIGAFL